MRRHGWGYKGSVRYTECFCRGGPARPRRPPGSASECPDPLPPHRISGGGGGGRGWVGMGSLGGFQNPCVFLPPTFATPAHPLPPTRPSHRVLPIQRVCPFPRRDVELRRVHVLPRAGHPQQPSLVVAVLGVNLVREKTGLLSVHQPANQGAPRQQEGCVESQSHVPLRPASRIPHAEKWMRRHTLE